MYKKTTHLTPPVVRPVTKKNGPSWHLVSLVCYLAFTNISINIFSQAPSLPEAVEQKDTLNIAIEPSPVDDLARDDEVKISGYDQKPKFIPDPSKAWKYSAIIPGWGQAYNRSYWKIPIIYAGLATVVFVYTFNNNQFQKWRNAYIGKIDPSVPDEFPNASIHAIKNLMDTYRRYREYTILAGVAVWALNILEAYVYAHFLNFDVSEDLSLRIEPNTLPSSNITGIAKTSLSLKLTLNL